MKHGELEEIEIEIRQRLDDGRQRGGTPVQIMSRAVWHERQKHHALLRALGEILKVAASGLGQEKESVNKAANVLKWRRPAH
jgi:hypothetical protein